MLTTKLKHTKLKKATQHFFEKQANKERNHFKMINYSFGNNIKKKIFVRLKCEKVDELFFKYFQIFQIQCDTLFSFLQVKEPIARGVKKMFSIHPLK